MKVVSDAGPLISLGKINALFLLEKLYGEVLITREVYKEAVTQGIEGGHIDAFHIRELYRTSTLKIVEPDALLEDPQDRIDIGELESISLSKNIKADLLLVDDRQAREFARENGMKVKGTVGVIIDGYRQHLIGLNEAVLKLEELRERFDIWMNDELCRRAIEWIYQSEGKN